MEPSNQEPNQNQLLTPTPAPDQSFNLGPKKSQHLGVIFFVLVLLVGVGAFAYYSGIKQPAPDNSQNVATDETKYWKTYRNEEYGFEFEYPTNWHAHDKDTFVILLKTENFPEIPSEGFAYGPQIIVGTSGLTDSLNRRLLKEEYIEALSKDNDYTGKPTKAEWTKVNNLDLFKIEHTNKNMFQTLSHFYFTSDRVFNLYLYPFNKSNPDLLNNYHDYQKILSTFKFTK